MAIEHHITLEERTDTLAYASATTPPAPTMPNVKASAKKTKTFSVISLFSGCGGMDLASRVDLIFSENGMQSSLLSSFGLTRLMKQPAKHISGISDHIFIKAIFGN